MKEIAQILIFAAGFLTVYFAGVESNIWMAAVGAILLATTIN